MSLVVYKGFRQNLGFGKRNLLLLDGGNKTGIKDKIYASGFGFGAPRHNPVTKKITLR